MLLLISFTWSKISSFYIFKIPTELRQNIKSFHNEQYMIEYTLKISSDFLCPLLLKLLIDKKIKKMVFRNIADISTFLLKKL